MANPSMGSSPGVSQQVHRLEKNVLSVPNGIALAAAAMAPQSLSIRRQSTARSDWIFLPRLCTIL